MQKNLKKVHFLKKFCLENLFRVTQPLNFFVQKSWLDMHMIVHKFQKNLLFVLKTILTNPGLSEAIFWSFRLVPFGLTMFFQTFMMRALI